MQPSSRRYHLDACLDGKLTYKLLTESGFDVESHYARFGREPLDDEWIPIIQADGCIILTKDRNGDGVIFEVLREYQPCTILVSPKLSNQPPLLADVLVKRRQQIEAAFQRSPVVLWLGVDRCQGSKYPDFKLRYNVLGNGKLVLPPEPKPRRSRAR